jgi:hypothetical protein
MKVLQQREKVWIHLVALVRRQVPERKRAIVKRWRRSWFGRVAWPWLRKELYR